MITPWSTCPTLLALYYTSPVLYTVWSAWWVWTPLTESGPTLELVGNCTPGLVVNADTAIGGGGRRLFRLAALYVNWQAQHHWQIYIIQWIAGALVNGSQPSATCLLLALSLCPCWTAKAGKLTLNSWIHLRKNTLQPQPGVGKCSHSGTQAY